MKTKNLLKSKTSCALLLLTLATAAIVSCKKSNNPTPPADKISNSQLTKAELTDIARAGFSPTNAVKTDSGYLVEGDIFLSLSDLKIQQDYIASLSKAGPKTEQYRTTNIVTGLPKVIKVKVDAGDQQSVFTTAVTNAIKRYNDLGIKLTFKLLDATATDKPDITIIGADLGKTSSGATILGQSVFPSNGNPGSPIKLNSTYYAGSANSMDLATVVTHELGHAIGFRHTDFADRRYSCGYQSFTDYFRAANEGDGGVGAIHIPGTPNGADAGSWMLACSDGTDRPFTANDIIAIKALYPKN